MQPFEIDGKTYRLDQLKLELPSIDLISWLSREPLYPKVFWKEKEGGITRAAVGNLLCFSHVPSLKTNSDLDIRLYGGMRFAQKKPNDETWRGFPQSCFWLPKIEVSQSDGTTEAIIYYLNEKASLSELQQLDFTDAPLPTQVHSLIAREEAPDFSIWEKNVDRVLEEIANERINKLVLARKTSLHFASPPSPWPLLAHLREKSKQATVFAFQLSPVLSFLGASPEKFLHRRDNILKTDAIAATRPRGKTAEEDLKLERELLADPKERREFQCVRSFIQNSLMPFSDAIEWEGQDEILKTSHVQHIHNRLRAKLKSHVSDRDLIQLLHPTPALGGFPKEIALSLLNHIEPFDRGWYGAPVGVLSTKDISLYVAIRSGLIRERSLHLFAGTGLVEGSVAKKEWDELENKIRPFTEIIF